MVCPRCSGGTLVAETHALRGGEVLARRRQCEECGYRFTTHEAADDRGDETRLVLASIRRDVDRLAALLGPGLRAKPRRGG